jgi:hypothetical protein
MGIMSIPNNNPQTPRPLWKPENTRIDYNRADGLEQAIRDAASRFAYEIIDIHIYAGSDGRPPRIEIELSQQVATYASQP